MGQGERIEILNPCPLTPSSKRSLRPQGIKKSLNLHFRPIPILVTVSLALILMAISLWIFCMWVPLDWLPTIHGFPTPELDDFRFWAVMWIVVISVGAVLIVRRLHFDGIQAEYVLLMGFILIVGGLVIFWMVMQFAWPHDLGRV